MLRIVINFKRMPPRQCSSYKEKYAVTLTSSNEGLETTTGSAFPMESQKLQPLSRETKQESFFESSKR